MRIIADQKDYYDCIQAAGQDRTLLYIRTPETIEVGHWTKPFGFYWSVHDAVVGRTPVRVTEHVIGFCGKIYPVVQIATGDAPADRVFCFSLDEVDSFVEQHLTPTEHAVYLGTRRRRRSMFIRFDQVISRWTTSQFFDDCKAAQDQHRAFFEDKRCPIFVATPGSSGTQGRIVYNSLLRPYEFYRVIEPYRAFQEIAMFLANMAQPEKPMPTIPDELKAESKGFDKWSFRRPPGQ
jgi:hypothetical protein